jgi:hypothetical protein
VNQGQLEHSCNNPNKGHPSFAAITYDHISVTMTLNTNVDFDTVDACYFPHVSYSKVKVKSNKKV